MRLVPTNKSKGKNKKYENLRIKIRDLIRSMTKMIISKTYENRF